MDIFKGIVVGLLFLVIFVALDFVISTLLYSVLVWIFGETRFSDRFLSAIPYLMARGLQVAASAGPAAFVAAWVCRGLVNARSSPIALATFVLVYAVNMIAGVVIEVIKHSPEWIDIVYSFTTIALAYGIANEVFTSAIARREKSRTSPGPG